MKLVTDMDQDEPVEEDTMAELTTRGAFGGRSGWNLGMTDGGRDESNEDLGKVERLMVHAPEAQGGAAGLRD